MQRNIGRAGDIYYHTTASDREWVNPGQIPIFKKLFAEFDSINQRLNRLETSLVQFANAHKLQHNGSLESVIGALCAEVQVIRTGKPYLAVTLEDNVIKGITKPSQLIVEQPLPQYVIDTYYTVENGTIVENEQQKELVKGVLL
jgi:hypothetical protein